MLGLPDTALSALFEQAGVIRVDDLIQQFDVAQLLACQPLPAGPRVGLVSNSDALALLAVDACARAGLEPRPPVNLGARAAPPSTARPWPPCCPRWTPSSRSTCRRSRAGPPRSPPSCCASPGRAASRS
nr:hypothetical protein GCM10020093_044790 [Planobispora longispora]